MKRFLTFLLTVAVLTCGAQSTQKVLFIGNSYTYVNDLPGTVRTLALGCGDTLNFEQSTPGGCTFQSHLSNATTTSPLAATAAAESPVRPPDGTSATLCWLAQRTMACTCSTVLGKTMAVGAGAKCLVQSLP